MPVEAGFFFSSFVFSNFLYILFAGLEPNAEGVRKLASTRHSHRSAAALSPSLPVSLSLSLTCHLPVKTFTIQSLSFIPLPHFSSCCIALFLSSSIPRSPVLILVMPGPQCVWLKCSPWRNKICEENFIVSASSSSCTGGKEVYFSIFLSWWFLAPVTMFLSGCLWIETW